MAVKKKTTAKRKSATKKKRAQRSVPAKKKNTSSSGKKTLIDALEEPENEVEEDKGPPNLGFKFPKGNSYWQCRAKHGRDGIWKTPEALLADCLDFFQWVEDNPVKETKVFAHQGEVSKKGFVEVPKMRPATIKGLCMHLGIVRSTWKYYKLKPDFSAVCEYVEGCMEDQKFVGAAAGLLNPAIIARDLGLKDQIASEVTGKDGGPIVTKNVDKIDLSSLNATERQFLRKLIASRVRKS